MNGAFQRLLLFDDEPKQRELLEADLTAAGFHVMPAASWDDVIIEIKERCDRYDFAVFDLEFTDSSGDVKDGLQLCRRVAELNPSLPIILYHDSSLTDPSSSAGRIIPTPSEAIAAGAYRLVVQSGVKEILAGLVGEMLELDEVSHELDKLKEARCKMGHLALGLGVGFQLVDQWGKVWFMDNEFARIAGDSGLSELNCFCRSHGYPLAHGPCHNCIAIPLIKSGCTEPKDATFYSPTYPNGAGTAPVFQYLYVRVTPIRSLGQSSVGGDSRGAWARTIAAIEAVSKVSPTSVDHFPRHEHLAMLAATLQDMGVGRRVAVFQFRQLAHDMPYGALVGIVARTGPAGPIGNTDIADVVLPLKQIVKGHPQDKVSVDIRDAEVILDCNDVCRAKLCLVSSQPSLLAVIFRPDGSCLGAVLHYNADAAQRPRLIAEDLSAQQSHGAFIPPDPLAVCEEIGRVLLQKPKSGDLNPHADDLTAMVECERIFDMLKLRVTTEANGKPLKSLQTTLEALVSLLPGLSASHIRRIDGDWAESVAFVGDYGCVATKRIDTRTSKRLTARVARTRNFAIIHDLDKEYRNRPPGWDEFDNASWDAILAYQSHAMYPLVSGSRLLGTVSFQGRESDFFTPPRQHLLRLTCTLLTRTLEDWDIIDHAVISTELPLRAAMLVAHNLGQPVATIQRYVDAINRNVLDSRPFDKELTAGIERQIKRMADMKSGLISLLNAKPGEFEPVRIRPIMERLVFETLGDQDIESEVHTDLEIVTIRPGVLQTCVPVLLKNAVEALTEPLASVRRIDIRAIVLEDGTLEISVCDTGPGVPDALVPKLFDPMQSGKSGGMGIGLALARHIAKSNGGQLAYNREFGVTAFTLRLPQHI